MFLTEVNNSDSKKRKNQETISKPKEDDNKRKIQENIDLTKILNFSPLKHNVPRKSKSQKEKSKRSMPQKLERKNRRAGIIINEQSVENLKQLIEVIEKDNLLLHSLSDKHKTSITDKLFKLKSLQQTITKEIIENSNFQRNDLIDYYKKDVDKKKRKFEEKLLEQEVIQKTYNDKYRENYLIKKSLNEAIALEKKAHSQHKKYIVIQNKALTYNRIQEHLLKGLDSFNNNSLQNQGVNIIEKEKTLSSLKFKISQYKLEINEKETKREQLELIKKHVKSQINMQKERNKALKYEIRLIKKDSMKLKISISKLYQQSKTNDIVDIISNYKKLKKQREEDLNMKNLFNKEIYNAENNINQLNKELLLIRDKIEIKKNYYDQEFFNIEAIYEIGFEPQFVEQVKEINTLKSRNRYFELAYISHLNIISKFVNIVELYHEDAEKTYKNFFIKGEKKGQSPIELTLKSEPELKKNSISLQNISRNSMIQSNSRLNTLSTKEILERFLKVESIDLDIMKRFIRLVQKFFMEITFIFTKVFFVMFKRMYHTINITKPNTKKLQRGENCNFKEEGTPLTENKFAEIQRKKTYIFDNSKEIIHSKDSNARLNNKVDLSDWKNFIFNKILKNQTETKENEDSYVSFKKVEKNENLDNHNKIDIRQDNITYFKRMGDINKLNRAFSSNNNNLNHDIRELYFQLRKKIVINKQKSTNINLDVDSTSNKKSLSISKKKILTKEKSDYQPQLTSFNKKYSSNIKKEINPQIDILNLPLNLKSYSTRNKITSDNINDNNLDSYLKTTNTLNFTNNFMNRNNLVSRHENTSNNKKPGTASLIKTSFETPLINYNPILSSKTTHNRSHTMVNNSNNVTNNYTNVLFNKKENKFIF